mmetsp:Transcript_43015/g.105155  ORF Transcript_43015/g.105155 Transcript_43015/m.105155 type:complete len:110 (+) Transcript_43015:130-459(+)
MTPSPTSSSSQTSGRPRSSCSRSATTSSPPSQKNGSSFTYTSLFGAFVCYIFLRTGQLLTAVAVHAFCNFMGFPDFVRICTHERRLLLVPCLLVGVATFYVKFKDWTHP